MLRRTMLADQSYTMSECSSLNVSSSLGQPSSRLSQLSLSLRNFVVTGGDVADVKIATDG